MAQTPRALAVAKNYNAETAYYRVMNLAGGESVYGTSTLAAIWTECHANTEIQDLAGRYLYSNFDYAERALAKLDDKLREVFGL